LHDGECLIIYLSLRVTNAAGAVEKPVDNEFGSGKITNSSSILTSRFL